MGKIKWEREKEVRVAQALRKYPSLMDKKGKIKFSERRILKYAKALETYPDLKELPVKLATIAYDFRQEQLGGDFGYGHQVTTELANARCDIQMGGINFSPSLQISENLPALRFDKECIICHEKKKTVSLCPECWQFIRKCLELKAAAHPRGKNWTAWGYEWDLNLRNLKKLLKSDREGRRLLEEARQREGHLPVKA